MHPHPHPTSPLPGARSHEAGVVCVTIRRAGHFWRFACDGAGVRELFERLAELADSESPLAWDEAELVAAQILSNQTPDRGQPIGPHDR